MIKVLIERVLLCSILTFLLYFFLAMAPPRGIRRWRTYGFFTHDSYFVAFYFLLIAPQRKKQKQHQKMINALEKGDNVKTMVEFLEK